MQSIMPLVIFQLLDKFRNEDNDPIVLMCEVLIFNF